MAVISSVDHFLSTIFSSVCLGSLVSGPARRLTDTDTQEEIRTVVVEDGLVRALGHLAGLGLGDVLGAVLHQGQDLGDGQGEVLWWYVVGWCEWIGSAMGSIPHQSVSTRQARQRHARTQARTLGSSTRRQTLSRMTQDLRWISVTCLSLCWYCRGVRRPISSSHPDHMTRKARATHARPPARTYARAHAP